MSDVERMRKLLTEALPQARDTDVRWAAANIHAAGFTIVAREPDDAQVDRGTQAIAKVLGFVQVVDSIDRDAPLNSRSQEFSALAEAAYRAMITAKEPT